MKGVVTTNRENVASLSVLEHDLTYRDREKILTLRRKDAKGVVTPKRENVASLSVLERDPTYSDGEKYSRKDAKTRRVLVPRAEKT
ncbi:hypothetical protein [Methanocalculus sp.]|uniref:hypothetical protein n=1 Tax=Methanocalculus sp. TaxID=2004547 RepID=UPI0027242FDF|nr:hypothetical protein [Methanocalculus sp.]MDO8841056.1 hypothetical protein [Methanocalculus sp.]